MSSPWPFATTEQKEEYEDLRAKGYAKLKAAHELWMAAVEQRRASAAGPAVLVDADTQDLGAALSELEGEICRVVEG